MGNKCGNVAWNRFFFYWKGCLGVYVFDIKRNQILLQSSTHLNIILRFDFKLRLCGSLVGMCFPALTAIYTLFCFLFLSGSELVWKIMKMSSMEDIWIKKNNWYNMIFTKWNFEVKWRGRSDAILCTKIDILSHE